MAREAVTRNMMMVALAMGFFLSPLSVHALEFSYCGNGPRINCVVDGDTIWINGEKIRLVGIDAPEDAGTCYQERILSARSTERLRQLASGGPVTIQRQGRDRYGRTLAKLLVNGHDLGQTLVNEGLARKWRGRRENWC